MHWREEIERQLYAYQEPVHRGNPTAQKYVRHVGALLADHVLIRREDAAHYAEVLNLVLEIEAVVDTDLHPSLAMRLLELRNVLVMNSVKPIKPGDYLLEIVKCTERETPRKRAALAIDFRVIEATPGSESAVGETVRYILIEGEYAAITSKALFVAATGEADASTLPGKRVRCRVSTVTTKDECSTFTHVAFRSVNNPPPAPSKEP